MLDVLRLLCALLWPRRKTAADRDAEILFLRQQLIILRRTVPKRIRLRWTDRLIFVCLYRLFPSVRQSAVIFQPETLIRWHRSGLRLFWRRKPRRRTGRPPIPADVRALVRRMSRENPFWGAPRIHGELPKLGITIAQSTVAKYMGHWLFPPSQGWSTFLRNHAPQIAAVDLFVVPTLGFKLLYALVVPRLERHLQILMNVTANPTADWVARQITEAFPWDQAPRYLIRDRDGVYGIVFRRRLRAMGIRDRPIAPRSPWQNGHVERLIGSIRRECLDHLVVRGEAHLRRVLADYTNYYNTVRTHLSLGKDTPLGRPVMASGQVRALPILGGLHHHYVRMA
jgi:transposase InsO family protein